MHFTLLAISHFLFQGCGSFVFQDATTRQPPSSRGYILDVPRLDRAGAVLKQAPTSDVEKQVLVDFYYSTNGEGWIDSTNWLVGDPCLNQWHGVYCYEDGGVYYLIFLDNNNFT